MATGTYRDGLNNEQLSEKNVSIEDIDQKGLVKRQKVNDQTVFDHMFVCGEIEMSHHEAVHLFIEDLNKSGTSIKSVDVKAFGGSPFHKKGDAIAEKRMIFSDAFRAMIEAADDTDVKSIMAYCHRPYEFSKKDDHVAALAKTMRVGLNALAKHYKVHSHRDPRLILRAQVYSAS
jgi:hypothetical protein